MRSRPSSTAACSDGEGRAVEEFRETRQILLSTEAGGEGRNLQFCRTMVNFDLPWNPMRIEQRIGRIHRLGQTRDIRIYNFTTRDTVEDYVLTILHQKIKMFELVIGEMDMVLGHWSERENFEQRGLPHLGEPSRQARSRRGVRQVRRGSRPRAQALREDPRLRRVDLRDGRPPGGGAMIKSAVLQHFVREWLAVRGIVPGTAEQDVWSFAVPKDLRERLGRSELSLSFNQRALSRYPRSELATVGNPVFDRLLAVAREEGRVGLAFTPPPTPAARPPSLAKAGELGGMPAVKAEPVYQAVYHFVFAISYPSIEAADEMEVVSVDSATLEVWAQTPDLSELWGKLEPAARKGRSSLPAVPLAPRVRLTRPLPLSNGECAGAATRS